MSYTSIFCFDKESRITDERLFQNSWFSAPRIWDALGRKYVNGFRNSMLDWNKLNEVLKLTKIEKYEAIADLSTWDNVLVKRKDFQDVVDAFKEFEEKDPAPEGHGSTLMEQALFIEEVIKNHPEVEYIGWNQTSVNGDDWTTPDLPEGFEEWSEEEQDAFWDDPPSYNINTMHRHWFMFTDDEEEKENEGEL